MKKITSFIFASLFIFSINTLIFAQQNGSLTGQVYDSLGAVLVGATVIAVDSNGKEKSVITNKQGEFVINGLAPGKYIIRATAPNFSLYESTDFEISAGQKSELTIAMTIAAIETKVEVGNDNQVDQDPSNNASQTVLKGKDIDDLPDDPDELTAYLQAMAGAASGPDGAQISIDGFSGGRMPPKEAIREIRFNQNPFSAEYDRIGFGRVDILTKPGFDKFRGGANFNFNDESLNSRNPFSVNRAPSQARNFGGNLSGPIKSKKSSFFVDFNYNQNDNSNVITATILDASNNIVGFNQDYTIPTRRIGFSPRVDYALNDNNTLQGRYSFSKNTSENQGIGGFSLPTRAFDSENIEHEFNITESMIINPKTVNETRFQYQYNRRDQNGDNSIPSIFVSSAFNGGGAQIGANYNKSNRWELQNYTTTSFGKSAEHPIKFGFRLRSISIDDYSVSGYGGSFTFAGVRNPVTGDIIYSSIEQYRQKVLGNPDPIFNPTQYSLTTGNPLASVSQIDYGIFITDDWKARKDLTLSVGLRYENQTNIHSNFNFAPRIGFAWQPGLGGAKQPKTVFRGGFGIFYDRFGEGNTLTTRRRDGVSQLNYVVTNNAALLGQAVFTNSGVTNAPTAAQLASLAPLTSIPYRVDDSLQSPYSIQSVFSVERQLPMRSTISATFLASKSLHILRMRNINAPVCPTIDVCPADMTTAAIQLLRPDKTLGNVFQFESSGYSVSKQLNVNFRTLFSNRITLFGNYSLSYVNGDTDSFTSFRGGGGGGGFPAYTYDLSGELAESSFNSRHSFFLGGSIGMPWGIRISPTIIANSSRRFNITSGIDTNKDSVFTERPTYAALAARCQQRGLTNSFCDISGISNPGTTIIPRNYGDAPGSFVVNMNLSKTFGFGGPKTTAAQDQNGNQQGNNRGGNRGGGGGGGGRGGRGGGGGGPQVIMMGGGGGMFMGGGGDASKPYNLTVGINVRNIFNNVNLGSPQGSLTSPYFGESISTGGGFGFFGGGGGSANRRVDLSMRFNW